MTDPWAAASSTATQTSGESQLADSYAKQESQLFSSGGAQAGPSIINKTHPVGTERTGIIAKAPYDRQSTNTKGEPKFWQDGVSKPVTEATAPNGKANRPVMDTVIELDTDYVMDRNEAIALNRSEPFEGGRRSFTAGGVNLKLLREAIQDANKRGIAIRSGQDLVGKRFTIKRVDQKPNPNGGDPIKVHTIRIDNA